MLLAYWRIKILVKQEPFEWTFVFWAAVGILYVLSVMLMIFRVKIGWKLTKAFMVICWAPIILLTALMFAVNIAKFCQDYYAYYIKGVEFTPDLLFVDSPATIFVVFIFAILGFIPPVVLFLLIRKSEKECAISYNEAVGKPPI